MEQQNGWQMKIFEKNNKKAIANYIIDEYFMVKIFFVFVFWLLTVYIVACQFSNVLVLHHPCGQENVSLSRCHCDNIFPM